MYGNVLRIQPNGKIGADAVNRQCLGDGAVIRIGVIQLDRDLRGAGVDKIAARHEEGAAGLQCLAAVFIHDQGQDTIIHPYLESTGNQRGLDILTHHGDL